MSVFKRGYKAVREEKERQEKEREKRKNYIPRFFIQNDGDEAEVRFLTEEPVNFYEHTIKTKKNGKDFYENVVCSGKDCQLCADGDRPIFKGAFLIVDRRTYQDKEGKERSNTVKLFVQGAKVLSQLDRISQKYGLSNRDVTIVRLGSGQNTTYTIEKGEKEELTSKEIENLLPEHLRSKYDGSEESLYTIIEDILEGMEEKEIEEEDEVLETETVSLDDEEDEKPNTNKKSLFNKKK